MIIHIGNFDSITPPVNELYIIVKGETWHLVVIDQKKKEKKIFFFFPLYVCVISL